MQFFKNSALFLNSFSAPYGRFPFAALSTSPSHRQTLSATGGEGLRKRSEIFRVPLFFSPSHSLSLSLPPPPPSRSLPIFV